MSVTQDIRGKGAEVLGCFAQAVHAGVRIDLAAPRGGADTPAFSQAGQAVHDELHRCLLAVEKRAVGLQKVALASRTGALAPEAAAGMAIGPQGAQLPPAPLVTGTVRTKVHRRVARSGPSGRRGHGSRPRGRRRLGLHGGTGTPGAMRLVRQGRECIGLLGAGALGLAGRGWRSGCGRALPGPGERQQAEEP